MDSNEDEIPIEIHWNIQRISEEFEASWDIKKSGNIESLLNEIDKQYRHRLLKLLVEIDLEKKFSNGLDPRAEDYSKFGKTVQNQAGEYIEELSNEADGSTVQEKENDKGESNTSNIFEQINLICQTFRKEISRKTSPRLAQYIERVPASGKELLFANLLEIEINYRHRKGDQPTINEYLSEFPQYTKQIRQAFFEPTSSSIELAAASSKQTDATSYLASSSEEDLSFAIPGVSRLGEYELISELGRGGMGVVYEARHMKTDNRVALKTLPTGGPGQEVNAERLYRFRREFRRLSEIYHPNLVGMQTLEVEGSQWFFTMDLINGIDFLSYVRPDGEMDEDRVRNSLKQLATGIIELHRHGIIHRDLKPNNVMVSPTGQLWILDFGLAAEMQRNNEVTQTKSGMFAGTPRYAAPEQMFGERSAASDWYAFGTMIFEALTGEVPFHEHDPYSLLTKKQQEDPPRLSQRTEFPTDLAELADGLIRCDPNARLSTDTVVASLKIKQSNDSASTVSSPNESSVLVGVDESDPNAGSEEEVILVGRDSQLAQLVSSKKKFLKSRQPQIVWIEGLSGEGKSSLAESFLRPIKNEGEMLVFSGRCYDRESVPFKVLDSIIEQLVRYLRSIPSAELQSLLPKDIIYLSRLFPALNRVDEIEQRKKRMIRSVDAMESRYRAFTALHETLSRISATKPCLLFVDDLQWGDSESAIEMLKLLTSEPIPNIFFLGCYRSDEAAQSPFLGTWENTLEQANGSLPVQKIELHAFSEEDCIQLIQNFAETSESSTRPTAKRLFAESRGNPYFANQLLESYSSGSGSRDRRLGTVVNHVESRLSRLPAGARKILELVSLAQRAESIQVILNANLQDSPYSILTPMRSEKLVRLIGDKDNMVVDTYHDKIRETVTGVLDSDQLRSRHMELGLAIESVHKMTVDIALKSLGDTDAIPNFNMPRVFDLSYHFSEAGDPLRTVIYSLCAAENATQSYAIKNAIEKYRLALKHIEAADQEIQYRVLLGFGKALNAVGQYEEANTILEDALQVAPDDLSSLKVKLSKAEILYMTASLHKCIDKIDELLIELGMRIVKNRWFVLADIFRQFALLGIKRIVNALPFSKLSSCPDNIELCMHVLHMNGRPSYFCNPTRSLLICLVGLKTAIGYSTSKHQGMFSASLGVLFGTFGIKSIGRKYYRDALSIAEQLDDFQIGAYAELYQSWNSRCHGQFQHAMEHLESAGKNFQKMGDSFRSVMVLLGHAKTLAHQGATGSAIEVASDAYQTATQQGQNRLAQSAVEAWAISSIGDLPFQQLIEGFEPIQDDYTTAIQMLAAEAEWHSFHKRNTEALNCTQKAVSIMQAKWIFTGLVTRTIAVHAGALRMVAIENEKENLPLFKKLRKKALRYARWAVRAAMLFKSDRPKAYRELSESYLLFGRLRKAKRIAQKSLKAAKQIEAKSEAVFAEHLCAKIDKLLGVEGADQSIEEARTKLDHLKAEINHANKKACEKLSI